MVVTHTFTSAKADTGDSSLIRPSDWNADHTVDWAETSDLAPVSGAASAGSGSEVPRSDHVHQDSAAGRIYAYYNLR